MITLRHMSQDEYERYLNQAILDYAQDKVENQTWKIEEAFALSKESYLSLLPLGLKTLDHYLFTILNEENIALGSLWVHVNQSTAFLYDFVIDAAFRNQGYGKQSLQVMETFVKGLGVKTIGLHVFGSNDRALHVYLSQGFKITDYRMIKNI